jgi:ABC-2 type transport system permease protein
MSKVLIIAWREFKQTVLKKAFLIGIIGIPLLIIGIGGATALILINHEEPPLVGTVAVADASGKVAEAARAEFHPDQIAAEFTQQVNQAMNMAEDMGMPTSAPGGPDPASMAAASFARGEVRIEVEAAPGVDDPTVAQLRERVRSGDLLAAAIIPPDVLAAPDPAMPEEDRPTFNLYVADDLDSQHTDLIERRLGQAIVRVRAAEAGLDHDTAVAILRRPTSATARLMDTGEATPESSGTRELKQMIPMAFMMLLWIATFTAGQHLMMSTIEEKSNRVMEVLLSAVSPMQLMSGKIIGQGGVGLLIMAIYSSLGIGSLISFAAMHLIDPVDLVYLAVYFFMAYFMVASLMAAVGGAVSDIREANTLLTPVMLLMMVPLMLWLPISQSPNGAVATVCSFIPPTIPFAMILRVAADEPVPFWQIPATIVWGYLCMFAMMWMAAKVFRVGVLMYGKPPSPLELLKWLRYS